MSTAFIHKNHSRIQAAWVAARFRGQFQEPATMNVGQNILAILVFLFLVFLLFLLFRLI
jgi:hypothetical protein